MNDADIPSIILLAVLIATVNVEIILLNIIRTIAMASLRATIHFDDK